MPRKLSLIVPVYRDLESLRRCLTALLGHSDLSEVALILINDASPEPGVAKLCRQFRDQQGAHLIEHAENRGFVISVNEGAAMYPESDFIILNSDTEVPPGWLDRLLNAAAKEPDAASITPFSNNATICSYPNFCENNSLPEGLDFVALDQLFASANSGVTLDIPTGVGFCMFIRRAAWDAVGEFDEGAFGRGYGEENDWCLRAAAKGWRHLLCADLFVYHAGGVSFGKEAKTQQQNALKIISSRYPDYERTIAEFIEKDPLEPPRYAVDLVRAGVGACGQVLSEYRHRLLAERTSRYALDRARHQQVQTLDGLLADARQHVVEEAQRYEQILAKVRAEAAQTDGKYAAQIEQMAQGYAELEAKTRSLSEELDSFNRSWFVRLYRRFFMRRNRV